MVQIARWVVLGALFLIPFIPLYVADGMFFPFITGKGFAFRILVEVAVIAWGVLMLLDAKYRPKQSWLLWLYGGLVVWMMIADFLAINPHKAFWSNYERMDGWVTMIHVFLLFVVAGSVLSVGNLWRKWWLTFLSGVALVCAYGLFQIMGVLETHQGDRIDGTFGNAAYLPAYLLFGIAISIWQAFVSKGWLRYGLFILAGAQVFILLFTATRGALFGLVGALIFGAVLYAFSKGKKSAQIAGSIISVVVLLSGAFYLAKDSSFVTESRTLNRLSSVFELSKEIGVRMQIWDSALAGFSKRPFTGYGHEGFNYVFNENYKPSLFAQEQWFDRAHNMYLDWLIAGGVLALVLFLSLMAYAFFALFRKEFSLTERIFLSSALVAYGIQGVVVFDNLFTYVPLAMVLAYIHSKIGTSLSFVESLSKIGGATASGISAGVVVVGLVVMWQVNVPAIQASAGIIRSFTITGGGLPSMEELVRTYNIGAFGNQEVAEQMIARATSELARPDLAPETKGKIAEIALIHMQKEVEKAPKDARLWLQLATGLRSAGNYDGALYATDQALALSPKKQTIYMERGATLVQAERPIEAREAFYTAYELDTSFALPAAYAAAGDILTGNLAQAQTLLEKHYDAQLTEAPNIVFVAYQLVGETEPIIRVFNARIEASGGALQPRLELASLYMQLGMKAEAKKVIEDVVKEYPDTKDAAEQWVAQIDSLQ